MKCLVIGGGLAGLSTAVYLAKNGINAELLEASPKLGGKAYSFYNKKLSMEVDNGQHLLLGCYNFTLNFLDTINAKNLIEKQKIINIPFVKPDSRIFYLKTTSNLYPINLISALQNFKLISIKEKLLIGYLLFDLMFGKNISGISALEWLNKKLQSVNIIEVFWKPLIVSVFNTDIKCVPVKTLRLVLKELFLNGQKGFQFIVPKVPLSKLFVEPAVNYLNNNCSNTCLSEKVESISIENNSVRSVLTNKRIIKDFDVIVFAIPTYALRKIINQESINQVEYSPIISAHFKLNKNIFTSNYYALINSPIHWIFNKGSYISITTSAADSLINLPEEKISSIYIEEICKYFPEFDKEFIVSSQIIKEKRATFILSEEFETIRTKNTLGINNAFLAGDWTDTRLPSTIEGAIKSGKLTAEKIISSFKN